MIPPHLVIADFLSGEERAGLLQWTLANQDRFAPARVEAGVEERARKALCLRDLGPLAGPLRQRLLAQVDEWIAALRISHFDPSLIELELAAHNDGAFFAIHGDSYRSDQPARGDRLLSGVYYFHREPVAFSGGQLRLHRPGAEAGDPGHDIAPSQGRLVVFPSWWPHEVLRIDCPSGDFADSRFSVNCWIHRQRRAQADPS